MQQKSKFYHRFLKSLSGKVVAFVLGLTLFAGGVTVLAAWPNAPVGETIGGWLGTVFDLGNSDSSKLIIKSPRVGIGTNSPAASLHVKDATSAQLKLERDGFGKIWAFGINDARLNIIQAIENIVTLSITNTGEIGIGDQTPDNGLKLDVEGNIGAMKYCDQNGQNCKTITELGTGGSSGTSGWEEITTNVSPFDLSCEYKWQLTTQNQVYYPTYVSATMIYTDYSATNTQRVYSTNKANSCRDCDTNPANFPTKTYRRCGGATGTSLPTCTNGQILKYNTTTSKWECADSNMIGGGTGLITGGAECTASNGMQLAWGDADRCVAWNDNSNQANREPQTLPPYGLSNTYQLICKNGSKAIHVGSRHDTAWSAHEWLCVNSGGGASGGAVAYGGSYLKREAGGAYNGIMPLGCVTANILTGSCTCPSGYVAKQASQGGYYHYAPWDTYYAGYNCEKIGGGAASLPTCTNGQILKHNGTDWICSGESDPQVGTLTNNKWCTSDGSKINCTSNIPSTQYMQGGMYGYCSYEMLCSTYYGTTIFPAIQTGGCSCSTGFTRVITGQTQGLCEGAGAGSMSKYYYSCIKN